ncbi:MAG TPA: TerC/Alx family metal homeostasis membrane protein [Acidobacteriaceae bacterium]|nr:TerC/Alx family metal homeostasis membrane protein [Acidobacteriaceae bacterium]
MPASLPLLYWIAFHVLIAVMLFVDIRVTSGKHEFSTRRAAFWTAVWLAVAAAFAAFIFVRFGKQPAFEFAAGYLVEESLSVDNLFVFLLLFRSFSIDRRNQRRVLLYGVMGAIVMRGAFIAGGVALLSHFEWVSYIFAAILLFTAIRLLRPSEVKGTHRPKWLKLMDRIHPIAQGDHGEKFIVYENGQRAFTMLFVALVAVELTDIFFAFDSVPAVLAITRHPFIAYTSNVLAVMGLRALYVVLAGALERFHLLHYGLAIILAFVAAKMLLAHAVQINAAISLAVIVATLALFITLSLWRPPKPAAG